MRLPLCFLLYIIVMSVYMLTLNSCRQHDAATLFKKIPASHSGINFNNEITENDSINPLDLEFLYNGGGVAVGDFNNDELPDLYFTASLHSNKLYLNKGKMAFKDVTTAAQVTGEGAWNNGASVVDINGDGWQDIYVCTTIKKDPAQRRNLLYINQGLNNQHIPVFKEMAAAYGLADTSYSVHAAFFDYDNDGDLDMYLVTTRLAQRDAIRFNNNQGDISHMDVDKLFRNDHNIALHHPVFTDVSIQAGIVHPGFGLGINIADINRDGWKDIYVTNDFFGSDLLYINNHNGTFTNKLSECIKHTSQNAMGNDIGDINNDGLQDIIAVDMNPEDNYRKKMNMSGNNYFIAQNMLYEGTALQYVRNTLQLNLGSHRTKNDSIPSPVFADISFFSGLAETDWSWNPSIADFDNDGYRDIIITNGYPRDVTDHDFVSFRITTGNKATKRQLIDQIPQIKIPNYAFRNDGQLQFRNVTTDWGMDAPSFSNGAVYADLDNDGDLDYVINNINDPATVYENTLNSSDHITARYLQVQFIGDDQNRQGIGATTTIYYNHQQQVYENNPYRGYLSTVDTRAHFGLGNISRVDSVIIHWQGNKTQKLTHVPVNQILKADIKNATNTGTEYYEAINNNAIFKDITATAGISYRHLETDMIDFNTERLLPHKLSQYGPGLGAADVDGNGLDDIFIGGSREFNSTFLLQQPNGKFISRQLVLPMWPDLRRPEIQGVLLFDADKDGDIDVYCASGSNEFTAGSKNYQDHFFVNDGKGNFTLDTTALPVNHTSKSCIKAADIDNDGDVDLFLGGRSLPGQYPYPVSSFICRNDSQPGQIKFTDVTNEVAPGLKQIGLVCDALFTDFDNDGATDLLLAGEWMPLTFLKNNQGRFENATAQSGIADETGWWNSLAAGDFDNDGDMDYIAGNLGTNSFYHSGKPYPVNLYAKDFDNNSSYDAILTVFLKNRQGAYYEYTAQNRDDIVAQLPVLKKRFLTYKDFATADIHQLFPGPALQNALVLHANNFYSCFIKNKGNGRFEWHALPVMAQLSPIFGMVIGDFNHDGNLDVAINGNDYGNEVTNGQLDALNSVLLLGDGKGRFSTPSLLQSGLYIPGNGKALIALKGAHNTCLLAASQNRGPLKLFSNNHTSGKFIAIKPDDRIILITLNNARIRKEELYHGSSFLSQSSRFIYQDSSMRSIEIINIKGENRRYKGRPAKKEGSIDQLLGKQN